LSTPEEVLQGFTEHMREGRYEEAARYLSPAYLEEIGTAAEEVFAPPFRPTVESLMADDPEMTWVEAHDEVTAFESVMSRFGPWEPELAGIRSVEELRCLSPHEVAARWLEASDPGAHHRAAIDRLIEKHPEFRAQLALQREDGARAWDIEILGAIIQLDTSFVVWQEPLAETTEGGPVIPPVVAVLHRVGDSWKLATDPRPHSGPMAYELVAAVETEDGETVELSALDDEDLLYGDELF
jgi:hypothetical protein